MNTTSVAATEGTRPSRVPFVSTCPTCKHNQVQWETRRGLLKLLNGGYPVEAYCGICDEYWRISADERTGLAARLVR